MPKSSLTSFLLLAAFLSLRLPAQANPLVLDDERQPVAMISERVNISVAADKSSVSGVYQFRRDGTSADTFEFPKDVTSRPKHVNIFVPVLLPNGLTSTEYERQYGKPSVKSGGRTFTATPWNDLPLSDAPEGIRLPRNWSTVLYLYRVPLRFVGKTFEVRITYIQLHSSGDVTAYIPIEPPREQGSSAVTFTAASGRRLRLATALSVFAPARTSIEVIPHDRKLIQVRSVPGSDKTLNVKRVHLSNENSRKQ